MQFTPVWIVTLCVYLVSVLAIIFLAKLTEKPIDSYEFSFKRVFPFEALNHSKKPLAYKILLCIFVATSFAPIFNLLANKGQIENLEGLSAAICGIFGLAAICFAFLHCFDATHTTTHLVLFVLFICLTLLGNALAAAKGAAIYRTYKQHGENYYCSLAGGLICGVCALACVIISLNPKLKRWAVLEKADEGYVRPNVFILAFSEWLTFFFLVIGEVSYFLVLLIQ